MKKYFSIKIAGPAGYGIMSAGKLLGQTLTDLNFQTISYPQYPSQIRGGDNTSQTTFSSHLLPVPEEKSDVLIAFSSLSLEKNQPLLKKDALVIADRNIKTSAKNIIKIPFTQIAIDLTGKELVRNTISLGYIFGLLELPIKILEKQLKKTFQEKGKKIISQNIKAAREGYQIASQSNHQKKLAAATSFSKNQFSSGNEAIAQGIVDARCGYAAIYPMTPINSILTILADKQTKTGMTIFQPEDEIAGVNSAIGASFAGQRAAVATSGGGFSLMVEGFSMAGAAEIPLVVIEGMRAGPSSGMATWTSQEDLLFLIRAGNGEFPRIILTPGDAQEAYHLTFKAFNFADIYQTPVIVVTDKYLSESFFTSPVFQNPEKINRGKTITHGQKNYQRYQITTDGISPRAWPGQTQFLTNSYVHDEKGFSTDSATMREKMKEKLFKKLLPLQNQSGATLYGKRGAALTLVSWGSTKNAVLAVQKNLTAKGENVNFYHFWRPWPFSQIDKEFLKKAAKIVVVENNSQGQLSQLIRQQTGRTVDQKILKDNGRPFWSGEVEKRITEKGDFSW